MRVVDLDDDHPKLAGRVAAEVEAGGVEDVAEDPQAGDEGHLPSVGLHTVVAEVLPDPGGEVGRRRVEVIAVPE